MNRTSLRSIMICAALTLLQGHTDHTGVRGEHIPIRVADHAADRVGHIDDLESALAPLDASAASHVAARSGDWSDPRTWASGIPPSGARVVIPRDLKVSVTAPIAVAALDWVRVEGQLQFSPASNSQLSMTTLLITPTGRLSIGAPDHPVDADTTVNVLFAPRSARTRREDRHDILGGLIALGRVDVYGAPKAAFATPSTPLGRGTAELHFLSLPAGWRVGDTLLFPAADAAAEDERREIASLSDAGGRATVTLASSLRFDHLLPGGVTAEIPVGNLTRNVTFVSTDTHAIHQRAHLMIMAREPSHISGASFRGLGRTTATAPHTLPAIDAGGEVVAGRNPIGRYAVHFHLTGASRRIPPHIFSDNVIIDSPKYGLVNHGGHVIAENNVTYAIHGTHFFAENGSEIGAFRHNLAVFSRGSGELIEGRQAGIGDFGHGGHGFWSESPALIMEDNFAFHHAGPAYVIFAAAIIAAEGTQHVFFRGGELIANVPRENLDPPLRETVTAQYIPPTMVPFRFSRNTAAYSGRGLEIWHTNLIATHDFQSIVEDSTFWGVRDVGIGITYGVNTVIRHSTIRGSDPLGCSDESCVGSVGIASEGRTRNLILDDVHIADFSTGIRVPSRGITTISNSHFGNKYNILLYPAQQPGRQTIVQDNEFARHPSGGEDYHLLQGSPLFHGDVSMLFERDLLIVRDRRFPERTIYRLNQHPRSVPFRDSGIPELDGKTADQLRREYGLAIGGTLAPEDATEIQGVGGLVGRPTRQVAEMADEQRMLARVDDLQTGTRRASYTSNYDDGYGADCCNIHRIVKGKTGDRTGWRLFTERDGGTVVTRLTYVDATPPRFEIDPRISLEIHPDDVKYGVLIQGTLYDDGAGPEIVRATYDHLKVDVAGYVNVPFEYADRAGNVFHHTYRLRVTSRAAKRGADLSCCRQPLTFLQTVRVAAQQYADRLHRFAQRLWTAPSDRAPAPSKAGMLGP